MVCSRRVRHPLDSNKLFVRSEYISTPSYISNHTCRVSLSDISFEMCEGRTRIVWGIHSTCMSDSFELYEGLPRDVWLEGLVLYYRLTRKWVPNTFQPSHSHISRLSHISEIASPARSSWLRGIYLVTDSLHCTQLSPTWKVSSHSDHSVVRDSEVYASWLTRRIVHKHLQLGKSRVPLVVRDYILRDSYVVLYTNISNLENLESLSFSPANFYWLFISPQHFLDRLVCLHVDPGQPKKKWAFVFVHTVFFCKTTYIQWKQTQIGAFLQSVGY